MFEGLENGTSNLIENQAIISPINSMGSMSLSSPQAHRPNQSDQGHAVPAWKSRLPLSESGCRAGPFGLMLTPEK